MSFVVSRTPEGSIVVPAAPQDPNAESHSIGRTCLAGSFLVVTLCLILRTSGASTGWMGGLLGLAAGLAGAFLFLGWQEFTDDVARHFRRRVDAGNPEGR